MHATVPVRNAPGQTETPPGMQCEISLSWDGNHLTVGHTGRASDKAFRDSLPSDSKKEDTIDLETAA